MGWGGVTDVCSGGGLGAADNDSVFRLLGGRGCEIGGSGLALVALELLQFPHLQGNARICAMGSGVGGVGGRQNLPAYNETLSFHNTTLLYIAFEHHECLAF